MMAGETAGAVIGALRWRSIGPHRGGRVVAVTGDPQNPAVFYFGACSGGIWKTDDGGTYWRNVSDGFLGTAAIGAIECAPSDPNVIYAGTGEACIRNNVVAGDGVYRSTDGGVSWKHLGLNATRHIGRVRVHPHDPETAFVAALGDAFAPNPERGVFRTRDGGVTWEQVLFVSDEAGAVDLSIDPSNPRMIFAAVWQVRRTPWSLSSGGEGSGLWRSTDGGDSWHNISDAQGLPKGIKGRIGVAVSPARQGRVWALIEAKEGGLFRSDDYGATWQRTSDDREQQQRPWYYMHVFADPQDGDTCYTMNLKAWKSTDAGKTFTAITTPHGDNHDLWIDPRNPRRMIQGNDGGANVSYNGGESWSTIYNQPTAQFYHLAVDNRFPYSCYATQQDNSAIATPSHSPSGGIPWAESYAVGSSESGHIAVRPDNPNIVYSGAVGSAPGGGGALFRYDHATRQPQLITVYPEENGGWGPKDHKYRFQWTFPIVISPHDPQTLYACGNRVFKTTDEGMSWQPISPDLTRNDEERMQPSGGPITKDTSGAEVYCTVFAFAESPHERGVLWAGSDDGLVHLSRDGGASWQRIDVPNLPEWATVTCIEPSPHSAGSAYLVATRYKLGDRRPLIWKTSDYGANWQPIAHGLAPDEITRVLRADPERPGLLYLAAEGGVFVSFDDGGSWRSLRGNLPVVPVHDLAVKDGDLVAATHGRSFWILDDITPLRAVDGAAEGPALFAVRPAYRVRPLPGAGRPAGEGKNYNMGLGHAVTFVERKEADGTLRRDFLDAGENPPNGVIVTYLLPSDAIEVKLAFLDADGALIREFSSSQKIEGAPPATEEPETGEGEEGVEDTEVAPVGTPRVGKTAGAHRFVWNLRYPDATAVPGDLTTKDVLTGPPVPPGNYRVRLAVDGQVQEQRFELRKDPRVATAEEDLREQTRFGLDVRDKLSATHEAINRARGVAEQAAALKKRAQGDAALKPVADAADALLEAIKPIEAELIQKENQGQLARLQNPTRLNARLAGLQAVIFSADTAPPAQTREVFASLSERIDGQVAALERVLDERLPALEQAVRTAKLPLVSR